MPARPAIAVCLLVFFDQAAKFFVSKTLGLGSTIPLIKGALHITLVHNRGAAFGIFKGMTPLFIFLSIVAIFLIILYVSKAGRIYTGLRIGLLLILAGTIGNLIDRLRFGYVVDFIDLKYFYVFNIADTAITFGAAFLVYQILVMQRK